MILRLANTEVAPPDSDGPLANAFSVAQKDVLRIPYGDYPHSRKRIQRFDSESAAAIVADFANEKARDPSYQIPVYVGHPDVPELAADFTDDKAYAWIHNVTADPAGLGLHAKWSDAGDSLLANAHYRYISPYWACENIASPKPNSSLLWVRPVKLLSAGLTNRPNIKAVPALANDITQGDTNMDPLLARLIAIIGLPNTTTPDDLATRVTSMHDACKKIREYSDLQWKARAAADAALGNFPNEKPLDEVVTSLVASLVSGLAVANTETTSLKSEIANLKSSSASEKTAAETAANAAKTEIANLKSRFDAERSARIELVLANAVRDLKIAPANKEQWRGDLAANLEIGLAKIANLKPILPTQSVTHDLGARKAGITDVADRRRRVLDLVNDRLEKHPDESYTVAFANVRKDNAALFAEMHQPEAKTKE